MGTYSYSYKRMIIQFLLLNGFLQISAAPPSFPSSIFSNNFANGMDENKGKQGIFNVGFISY
jgi:hypothetical protein